MSMFTLRDACQLLHKLTTDLVTLDSAPSDPEDRHLCSHTRKVFSALMLLSG
jgi:hypothetical protein